MGKKSVLLVLRAPIGGLFRHVVDLSGALEARGHRVGIVADALTGAEAKSSLDALAALVSGGLTLTPMPRLPGPRDLAAIRHVMDRAVETGADLIHGHGAKGGLYARLAGWKAGLPSAYTPHGGSLHYSWKRPDGMIFLTAERLMMPLTSAFLFESAYGQKAFAEKIGTPACLSAVVPNGLRPAEFDAPGDDVFAHADLGFVGELRTIKGLDLLFEAMAPLKRADGTALTLLVAGSGPDENALREKAESLDLGDRVTFLGRKPARDVFASCDIVCVPSRNESLPYVVLEAGAAGCVQIATRVGGIAEIFGPTATRLVPREDVAALRAELSRLLDNRETGLCEAAERKAFIAATFSLEAMTDAVETVYDKIGRGAATVS